MPGSGKGEGSRKAARTLRTGSVVRGGRRERFWVKEWNGSDVEAVGDRKVRC